MPPSKRKLRGKSNADKDPRVQARAAAAAAAQAQGAGDDELQDAAADDSLMPDASGALACCGLCASSFPLGPCTSMLPAHVWPRPCLLSRACLAHPADRCRSILARRRPARSVVLIGVVCIDCGAVAAALLPTLPTSVYEFNEAQRRRAQRRSKRARHDAR